MQIPNDALLTRSSQKRQPKDCSAITRWRNFSQIKEPSVHTAHISMLKISKEMPTLRSVRSRQRLLSSEMQWTMNKELKTDEDIRAYTKSTEGKKYPGQVERSLTRMAATCFLILKFITYKYCIYILRIYCNS